MQTYAIARAYTDEVGKKLPLIFARFLNDEEKTMRHVSVRSRATLFLTREEAESSCPQGYHVDPIAKKSKKNGAKKGKGKRT